MTIRKLEVHETAAFAELLSVFKVVFGHEHDIPPTSFLQPLLSRKEFWVYTIWHNQQIIGGATMHVLPDYYTTQPLGYIYDVGILPSFQRQGFGKALIAAICHHCQLQQFGEVYVEAEAADSDAVHFYKHTQPSHIMKAVHFTYTFNSPSHTITTSS